MSCYTTSAQGEDIIEFENEADCDAALAIQNADCGECDKCSQWAAKLQRETGKWYFFKNPSKMVGISGVLTYTEKKISALPERQVQEVQQLK